MMKTIQVTIFHDTVCPWCRIGKKNLLTALQELQIPSNKIDITFQTFFLNRDIPVEGVNYQKYLTDKFDGVPLKSINETPTRIGKESGVNFNFDKITIIPNTILSNTLLFLTPADKKQLMVDRLGELYFEQGANIGDIKVLLNVASELGVSVTAEQLKNSTNQNEVIHQDTHGKELGITGVPFYIFNNKYALFGAQPVSAFKNVIQSINDDDIDVLL